MRDTAGPPPPRMRSSLGLGPGLVSDQAGQRQGNGLDDLSRMRPTPDIPVAQSSCRPDRLPAPTVLGQTPIVSLAPGLRGPNLGSAWPYLCFTPTVRSPPAGPTEGRASRAVWMLPWAWRRGRPDLRWGSLPAPGPGMGPSSVPWAQSRHPALTGQEHALSATPTHPSESHEAARGLPAGGQERPHQGRHPAQTRPHPPSPHQLSRAPAVEMAQLRAADRTGPAQSRVNGLGGAQREQGESCDLTAGGREGGTAPGRPLPPPRPPSCTVGVGEGLTR